MSSLLVLETRSLKFRCQQDWAPSKTRRGEGFPVAWRIPSRGPEHPLACSNIPPVSASIFPGPFSLVSVSLLPVSVIRTVVFGFRANTDHPGWSYPWSLSLILLANVIWLKNWCLVKKKTTFGNKVTVNGSGMRMEAYPSGDTIQPTGPLSLFISL